MQRQRAHEVRVSTPLRGAGPISPSERPTLHNRSALVGRRIPPSRSRGAASAIAIVASMLVACGDDDSPFMFEDTGPPPSPEAGTDGFRRCTEGEHDCGGNDYRVCRDGAFVLEQDCEAACDVMRGCVSCIPGSTRCDATGNIERCIDDGSGYEPSDTCDASMGLTCVAGICADACAEATSERSNVGCVYYPVDLDNGVDLLTNARDAQYAIAIANPGFAQAHIVIEQNDALPDEPPRITMVDQLDLAGGSLQVIPLPARELDGSTDGLLDDGPQTTHTARAYRLRSNLPVVVYQFNPIGQVFLNDASLLLPTSGIDTRYQVIGYPTSRTIDVPALSAPATHGYVTIVGTQDGTRVTVVPTHATLPGVVEGSDATVPAAAAGEPIEVILDEMDVLNLATTEGTGATGDLTGTLVDSDRPVVVYSGTDGASPIPADYMGEETCCVDHLEEQLLPASAWGKVFVAAHSPYRTSDRSEPDIWRFTSTLGTTLTTSLGGSDRTIVIPAGGFHELATRESFTVSATEPVQIGQLLVVQAVGGGQGDGSLLILPAIEQYRETYTFATGEDFQQNRITIIARQDDRILVDGMDSSTECEPRDPVGTLDGVTWTVLHCDVGFGVHNVTCEQPCGVNVYGYHPAGSYSYSAGSEIERIFLF
ncbi:MAG: IgGFc-binding protein [Deltaproteobacteria bacterium]|nr:IgGFc-binding protein [Deltaproteobacteria bacterium]